MDVWIELDDGMSHPMSVGCDESVEAFCDRITEEASLDTEGIALWWNGIDLLCDTTGPLSSMGLSCGDAIAVRPAPEKAAAAKLLRRGFRLTEEELIEASRGDLQTMCQLLCTRAIPHAGLLVYLAARNASETCRVIFDSVDLDVDPNVLTESGVAPLHAAAKHGSRAILQILLDNGADPNQAAAAAAAPHGRCAPAQTPLAVAVASGYAGMACDLLTHGANPNATSGPHTPLFLAIVGYVRGVFQLPLVETLLAHGADPNAAPPGSLTPLLLATQAGLPPVAAALVEAGAGTELRRRSDGATPLAVAVQAGSEEMVDVLLRCGSDVRAVDAVGRCPLDMALPGSAIAAKLGAAAMASL